MTTRDSRESSLLRRETARLSGILSLLYPGQKPRFNRAPKGASALCCSVKRLGERLSGAKLGTLLYSARCTMTMTASPKTPRASGRSDSSSLFTCPRCKSLFQTSLCRTKCLCPGCGVELQLPLSVGQNTQTDVEKTATTATPSRPVALDPTRLLRLRVWAASVRNREGEHRREAVEVSALAKTLCALLDMHSGAQADNARTTLESNIALLVGMMVLSGARWG